jgi:hypothetical protein
MSRLFHLVLILALPAAAQVLDGLPGEEVTGVPRPAAPLRPAEAPPPADSVTGMNWLAPPVHEQLARDPVLVSLGKGALFVPTFSEPRREPDIAVFNADGDLVATGQPGHRILLDSGDYEVRVGSGAGARRMRFEARVDEGRTAVLYPEWGGVLVETLFDDGAYFDGQYEIIRMGDWINYGRGQGYKEERLQDIEVWILPPGLYRLSKVGTGYNDFRNYITVQVNPGELHAVELVFKRELVGDLPGDLIAGGIKSLTTRVRVGQYWTYGLRAGGTARYNREVDMTDNTTQSLLFDTDLRLRARYDRAANFGITELFVQNGFTKAEGQPFTATTDNLQLRSTWVRRLTTWLGPYVRGQASTHLFPVELNGVDSVYITRLDGTRDTVATGGTFVWQPSLFPLKLAQGVGVNIEWLSRYEAEISTQVGLAARQTISRGDYANPETNEFREESTTREVGAEGVLNARIRIGSQFTLDLRAEALAENANLSRIRLENLEADLRYFLIRNIEIGYLFHMSEEEDAANRFPTRHGVSLRLNFNY